MRLYGTLTSPFARRVRIVAHQVEAPLELVRTDVEDGQEALRRIAPLRKVPVLDTGHEVLFDSHVIVDWLLTRFGDRGVRRESGLGRWKEANLMTVVDGALDAAINAFYLQRDGVEATDGSYLQKQRERVGSAMKWVDQALSQTEGALEAPRLGLFEIVLVTTLDWMVLRKAYDVHAHTVFTRFLAAYDTVPSLVETRPPT